MYWNSQTKFPEVDLKKIGVWSGLGETMLYLKVPKCDIFDLLFFALLNSVCEGDSGTEKVFFLSLSHFVFKFILTAHCALQKCIRTLMCACDFVAHTQHA